MSNYRRVNKRIAELKDKGYDSDLCAMIACREHELETLFELAEKFKSKKSWSDAELEKYKDIVRKNE